VRPPAPPRRLSSFDSPLKQPPLDASDTRSELLRWHASACQACLSSRPPSVSFLLGTPRAPMNLQRRSHSPRKRPSLARCRALNASTHSSAAKGLESLGFRPARSLSLLPIDSIVAAGCVLPLCVSCRSTCPGPISRAHRPRLESNSGVGTPQVPPPFFLLSPLSFALPANPRLLRSVYNIIYNSAVLILQLSTCCEVHVFTSANLLHKPQYHPTWPISNMAMGNPARTLGVDAAARCGTIVLLVMLQTTRTHNFVVAEPGHWRNPHTMTVSDPQFTLRAT